MKSEDGYINIYEILVVLLIIGIIAVIAVPIFTPDDKKADQKKQVTTPEITLDKKVRADIHSAFPDLPIISVDKTHGVGRAILYLSGKDPRRVSCRVSIKRFKGHYLVNAADLNELCSRPLLKKPKRT